MQTPSFTKGCTQRLGLPHLYSSPRLSSYDATSAFAVQVQSSPELAKLVRVLYMEGTTSFGHPKPISAPLVNLVRVTNRIQVLVGLNECIPAGETAQLERAAQGFLVTFPIAPRVFLKFPHLRHFTISGGHGVELDDAHQVALPQLEYLNVVDAGPKIFRLFGSMGYATEPLPPTWGCPLTTTASQAAPSARAGLQHLRSQGGV